MLQECSFRLGVHPGRCVPVGLSDARRRLGVGCDGEELDFDGLSGGGKPDGGDDDVVEWRFAGPYGRARLRGGGGSCAERAVGAGTEVEVEGGDGAVDLDHFADTGEEGVVAVDMGGEDGIHDGGEVAGQSVSFVGRGGVGAGDGGGGGGEERS